MLKKRKILLGSSKKYYFLKRKTSQADDMMGTYRCKELPTTYSEESVVTNVRSDQSDEVHSVIECETAIKSCEQVIEYETAMKSDEQVVEYETAMKYCEQVENFSYFAHDHSYSYSNFDEMPNNTGECETAMESSEQVVECETTLESCEQVENLSCFAHDHSYSYSNFDEMPNNTAECETAMESSEQVVECETTLESCEQVENLFAHDHSYSYSNFDEMPNNTAECETAMESSEQVVEFENTLESCEQVVECETTLESSEQVVECETTLESSEQVVKCETNMESFEQVENLSCLANDHSYSYSHFDGMPNNTDTVDGTQVLSVHELDLLNSDINKFEQLKNDIKEHLFAPYVVTCRENGIEILELYKIEGRTTLKLVIDINCDLQVKLFVHRKELAHNHYFWNGLPKEFDEYSKLCKLLRKLQAFAVCMGNPDEQFQDLIPIGAVLSDNASVSHAYREGDFCAQIGDLQYHSTIRSVDCQLLVPGRRCNKCLSYRRNLWSRKQRLDDNSKDVSTNLMASKRKHSDMGKEMLIKKIKQQKSCIKTLQSKLDRQRRELDRQIMQAGITVPNHQNRELLDLINSCQSDMEKTFPNEQCLQRLFWEQQIKFNKSGKNGMRWHPMIIRWCLYLRHKSTKAYDAMRDTGFIKLPSARTLFDYSHYVKSALGFQADVIKMLIEECSKKDLYSAKEGYKCYVGILFDEIKVKEDLVYDKHTGEIVGYCHLDSIGNQLLELEQLGKTSVSEPAKSMLVLMIRGVSTDLKFPLAGFATNNINSDFLYPIIWKAVHILENVVKLKVLFFTCDGASPNRKFFNLHKVSDENNLLVYSTDNPYDDDRKIFFISDVPHLVKTTRNCFANSYAHKSTRKLWKDGKDISWLHILKLYEEHCEISLYNPCPKLTRAHVDMTSFGCMKVSLAAQVLSSSVANALEELYDENVSETVLFIRNFNKFFDCLNVRSVYEGRNKRNPDLNPYKEKDDPRLDWLVKEFIGYLDNWDTSVATRNGNFTLSQRHGMKLSQQTLNGLKISVYSIVECVKSMLNAGASFVLTHHFNQDPIEQHFGHYRHSSGNNNNPSVYDIRNTMTQMRTIGAQALTPKNGNIQKGNKENYPLIDNTKLPKRGHHNLL